MKHNQIFIKIIFAQYVRRLYMKYKLSHKEVYVMQILWAAKEELSITDFIQRDPTLSTSTVQVVLRSLLKKSYIKVANIVQHNKVFARTYLPILSEEDYMMEQFSNSSLKPNAFFASFIEKEDNLDTLDALEELIKAQKEKLLKEDE